MFWIKIPKYMKDDNLSLRFIRIFDGPLLKCGLRDEILLKDGLEEKPFDSSWLRVWWWIRKTYDCSYCIDLDSSPIGFIGMYHTIPGQSTNISLLLFDRSLRRHGYGTRAFKLLAQNLQKYSAVKKIQVMVKSDNCGALSFWESIGFSRIGILNDSVKLFFIVNGEVIFNFIF